MLAKYAAFTILTSILCASYYVHENHSSGDVFSVLENIKSYVAEWFNDNVHSVDTTDVKTPPGETTSKKTRLFTAEELKLYNGEENSKGLYLAILGKVYDVGSGKKHYGPGGSYHFFTGRDGSKAFVTGDFTEEGLTDDVMELSPKEVKSILQWTDFYNSDYTYIGKVIGRYYDKDGKKTQYHIEVDEMINEAIEAEQREHKEKQLFPPCNVEWTQETGSRVWCSKLSGGIERDWIGVPRQLYEPGSSSFRCVCLKVASPENLVENSANLKEYPNCNPNAISCNVVT